MYKRVVVKEHAGVNNVESEKKGGEARAWTMVNEQAIRGRTRVSLRAAPLSSFVSSASLHGPDAGGAGGES